jgi:signal transduction histidine kinase
LGRREDTEESARIRQILVNIAGNEIKFTDQGGVELHVCFGCGLLEFEIQDTGRGISKEQELNLFQPFVQI